MNEIIRKHIEDNAKDILRADSIESYNRKKGYTRGLIAGFSIADEISEKEYYEMIDLVEQIEDLYWEQTKTDFASAHRRIFPEQ